MKGKTLVPRDLSGPAKIVLEAAKRIVARRKNKDFSLEELREKTPTWLSDNSVNKKALLLVDKGLLRKVTRGVYAIGA